MKRRDKFGHSFQWDPNVIQEKKSFPFLEVEWTNKYLHLFYSLHELLSPELIGNLQQLEFTGTRVTVVL